MANILYKKLKRQYTDNGVSWIDMNVYKVGEVLEDPSNCQSENTKICRWVELDESEGYICDETNFIKYSMIVEECTTDGIVWTRTGNVEIGKQIETKSFDCGYKQCRWSLVDPCIDYECSGYTKYLVEYLECTEDGETWEYEGDRRVSNEVYKTYDFDCGFNGLYFAYKYTDVPFADNEWKDWVEPKIILNNVEYPLQLSTNGEYFTFILENFDGLTSCKNSFSFINKWLYENNYIRLVFNLDTSNVTDMSYMFADRYNSFSISNKWSKHPNFEINNFNTSNVTDMSYMFAESSFLVSNLELSKFVTNKVTNMSHMFYNYSNDTYDLTKWNVSNVTDMSYMFYNNNKGSIINLSNWNVSNVTDMSYMFAFCDDVCINLSGWEIKGNTNIDDMFYNTSYGVSNISLIMNDCSCETIEMIVEEFAKYNNINNLKLFTNVSTNVLYVETFNTTSLNASIKNDYSGGYYLSLKNVQNFDVERFLKTISSIDGNLKTLPKYVILENDNNVTIYSGYEDKEYNFIKNENGFISFKRIFYRSDSDSESYTPPLPPTYLVDDLSYAYYNNKTLNDDDILDKSYPFDLSSYDLSNVTNVEQMFARSNIEYLILNTCNVSNIKYWNWMLYNVFAQSVDMYDCSFDSIKKMKEILIDYYKYPDLKDDPRNTFNYSYSCKPKMIYSMNIMGEVNNSDCNQEPIINCSDTLAFTFDGSEMEFYMMGKSYTAYTTPYIATLTDLGIEDFTDASRLFYECDNITKIIAIPDTSNVTTMEGMFNGCSGLTSLDISCFDTSNVTDMSYMFDSCKNLTLLDISSFDTSIVTHMRYMFSYCTGLTSLDLSNFDTSNVTSMNFMFEGCKNLTSLDLSNFNTSNVTNMQYMFSYCTSLTSLDLSNWDTSNVKYMSFMFEDCNSLTTVIVANCSDTTKQFILDRLNTYFTATLSGDIITVTH